ncbi:MAG: alpha/beta hydrolase [Stagnimonas sp.]|nr:alpha/beta hydrolase [Stagnimonas sp.]
MTKTLFLAAALAMSTVVTAATPHPATMPITWKQVAAMPQPPAGEKISYGEAPQQFGELRVPKGKGPFPVVVLIHGGCWLAAYDYQYINPLAAALTAQGMATWTIEYRRLGDEDGGWPNTLLDVAKATDHLRVIAETHPVDTARVISMGHSAGGHLALWLGARHKLAKTSELYLPTPLALKGVVGLAAITDLNTYRVGPVDSCNASVDQLMGGTPTRHPLRYAEASPRLLLPLGVPQWLVQGGKDPIVPMESVQAYATAARQAGDDGTVSVDPDLGHFDPAVPQTALGAVAVAAALNLLGLIDEPAPRR